MVRRLRLDQIERKPKKVYEAGSWRVRVDLKKKPELLRALVGIRRAIVEGQPLPDGCYRSGIFRTSDYLLQTHGIMHLHLGHPGTREVLYLVQYADFVVFLEVSDHIHLDRKPPGRMLIRDHQKKLSQTVIDAERQAPPVARDPPQDVGTPSPPAIQHEDEGE